MAMLVALIGVLIAAVGLLFTARPEALRLVLEFYQQGKWLYAALAQRVVMGVLLVAAADRCAHPGLVLVIGALALVSAAIGLFLGLERLRALAGWWSQRSTGVVRCWALSATGFGVLLVYAAV
ncbi:MAG: hypothetical protein ACE5E4_06980 [Candidatus Binatia bacterium]